MTAQQRDMIDQILRNAPFDLGGDVAALNRAARFVKDNTTAQQDAA
jgi:hypothetical protein